jgi:hypothetical protein
MDQTEYFRCPKCEWESERLIAMKPVCPECRSPLNTVKANFIEVRMNGGAIHVEEAPKDKFLLFIEDNGGLDGSPPDRTRIESTREELSAFLNELTTILDS